MVTVTDAAGAYMAELLTQANAQEHKAIRLIFDEHGFAPKMDQAREGDIAFSYSGRTVLVLDTLAMQVMEDQTLDVQQTEDGLKIVLR